MLYNNKDLKIGSGYNFTGIICCCFIWLLMRNEFIVMYNPPQRKQYKQQQKLWAAHGEKLHHPQADFSQRD